MENFIKIIFVINLTKEYKISLSSRIKKISKQQLKITGFLFIWREREKKKS